MASLYEIEEREMRLCELLEIDIRTDEQEAEICAAFDELCSDKENASDRYTAIIRNKMSEVDAIDAEIDRLKGLRSTAANVVDRIKKRICDYMLRTDQKRLHGNIGSFYLRSGSQSVEIENEALIPSEFIRIVPEKREVDKNEIKAAIRSGVDVPGAVIKAGNPILMMK